MMGVLLHAHYRLFGLNGDKIVMPAPIDAYTPQAPWWWDLSSANTQRPTVGAKKYSWWRPPSTAFARTATSSRRRCRDLELKFGCVAVGGSGKPGPKAICGRALL